MNWLYGTLLFTASVFFLGNCSFDENIVLVCGQLHANSIQGQFLCQQRKSAEKRDAEREKEAAACLAADKPEMKKLLFSVRDRTIEYTGKELTEATKLLSEKFNNIDFSITNSKFSPYHRVIIGAIKTKCASKYAILINIDPNSDGRNVERIRAWENSPPRETTDFNIPIIQ